MKVFEEVEIPKPLDYVHHLVHEGKVFVKHCTLLSFNSQIDEARMHLVDVSAKAQESEDTDSLGWHAYYQALTQLETCPEKVKDSIASAVGTKKASEEEDAKLIFHSFSILSDHFARNHGDSRICGDPGWLLSTRTVAGPTQAAVHAHHQASDRVWSLARSGSVNNPLVLNSIAARMTALHPRSDAESFHSLLDASFAYHAELGRKFIESKTADLPEASLPVNFSRYLTRIEVEPGALPSIGREIDTLVSAADEYLACTPVAVAATLSVITKGLAMSVPLNLRVSTSRLLIRLAKLKLTTGSATECLLILDDIEGPILSNSGYLDIGIFSSVKAECLLSMASSPVTSPDDQIDLVVDAMKCIQLAVSAYDKGGFVAHLSRAVALAAALANKLKVPGLCNFYSVKYSQIAVSNEGYTRFFPVEEGSMVVTATGQPKLPSDLTNSPKPARRKDRLVSPMSPVGRGRGLQTLISWNSGN